MAAGDDHVDVVALALGEVDGQRRTEMAAHLMRCQECRLEYMETTGVLGELLPAAPAVQPALGFDERVLRRLGVGPSHSRHRWPRWLAGVAAVAAAVLLVTGVWSATRSADEADAVAALELTADRAPVGTVSVSEIDGRRVMVVAIVDAPDGVSYTCRALLSNGRAVESEPWPAGTGAWIVPLPDDGDVRTVDLVVTGTDIVWSAATFE